MQQFGNYFVGGYIVDPRDPRDWTWGPIAKQLASSDASSIYLPERTPISDQGPKPLCVANAGCDATEQIMPVPVQLSRTYGFAMSCLEANIDGRSGTYIRSFFAAYARHGICLESDYPYDRDPYVRPSMDAMRKAVAHKLHAFYRIASYGSDFLDEADAALINGLPTVFGTYVGQAFFDWKPGHEPLRPPVGDPNVGGHAMVIVGRETMSNGERVYLIRNSYGRGYGDNGYLRMHESYLTWNHTIDKWVPTAGPVLQAA